MRDITISTKHLRTLSGFYHKKSMNEDVQDRFQNKASKYVKRV